MLQVVSVAANGAPTSLTHALQTTVDEVCRRTGWTIGHVLLRGEQSDGPLVSSGIWHVDASLRISEVRRRHATIDFDANRGVPGRVFATGRPEYVVDVHELSNGDADRVRCDLIDRKKLRAVAAFPIMIGDEVAGVLEFFARSPFGPDHALLDVLAQAGLILGRIVERVRYEAALRDAREVAEVANAAKTEFLSRMSHELRTPLSAVLGYAELMELGTLDAEESRYLAAIQRGGGHLLALINDVLNVSRLEKGELALSIEPVDVAAVIREVVELLQPLAVTNQVTLRIETAGGAPRYAMADGQGLRQVLLNLVGNAIKYNRAGGGVVVRTVDAGKQSVRIDVADTGKGVAAADLDAMFVPFERLGAKGTVEGTGLGLGISRQLVQAMGGTLTVESTLGKGTTLSTVLGADSRPPAAEASPPPHALTRASDSHKILYVDDNLANVEYMEVLLSKMRPDIQVVSTMMGALALDLAREHVPRLILLDAHLPDLDGDEVLRRLLADPRTRSTPVVIVSADATASGIERLLAAGAIGYITKPIDVARLLEFVDRATIGPPVAAGREVAGRRQHSRTPVRKSKKVTHRT